MQEITTKEVDEAAFLWSKDSISFKKVELQRGSTRTIYFIFTTELSTSEVAELRREYVNGDALVEPRKFSLRQTDVRNILHEALRKS